MSQVRLTKQMLTMDYQTQDPFNPHALFPQWSLHSVYPYQFWGSMRRYVVHKKFYTPSIENDYVRVSIAADIGGRIWDIYDKIGKRHLANFQTGVRSYGGGFGQNYTVGGIECNYPLAHACTTNMKREVTTEEYPDGSAAIIVSEYERIWRTRWSVAYKLYPDRSFVEVRVRIYNRTPQDSRYMYWNNAGFVLHQHTRFVYPEPHAAMHGEEKKTFSWPTWRHRDMSHFAELPPEALGLYMLDAAEPFFGYYDDDDKFGMVHYADLAELPGKKYWTWGNGEGDYNEHYRITHHTDNELYGEIQSGRIAIQEHLDRVPPETEAVWSGIWYPVRGTGVFNAAGPGAVMRAELVDAPVGSSRIKLAAMGNGVFPDARVIVTADGLTPIEQPLALDPKETATRVLTLKGKAGPEQHATIWLKRADGEVLARCRLRHPNTRDSWREVIDVKHEMKPVGAEEFFVEAEHQARSWGNNDLRPLYEKVLTQDSGFSPARRELGKVATWQGLYDEAIKHFDIARQRDQDSLELRYFHGVTLMRAGRIDEARKAFELACRYHWEAASLTRLAELYMREKDWRRALRYLDRVAEAFPRLTRPRVLRAACLRKLGQNTQATDEIAAARAVDGQDPFLQFEQMFIQAGTSKLPAADLKKLVDQIREDEKPLHETAVDYIAAGMFEEAEAVLRNTPNAGAIATYILAWTIEKQGRHAEAMKILRKACAMTPFEQYAWHLELIDILGWAREQLPKEPRTLLHLGNLLMARRRADDGAALWREAEKLGEKHYILFANLGHYERNLGKNPKSSAAYFQKAVKLAPEDLYVKQALFEVLAGMDKRAAIKYLEGEKKALLSSPRLCYVLMGVYLELNEFRKFDELASKVNFTINWGVMGPNRLYNRRMILEAILQVQQGDLRKALTTWESLGKTPAHLGVHAPQDVEADRRLYHMGIIWEKLGNMDKARECWQKCIELPHYTGFEIAYWNREWGRRYFQALSLKKLGHHNLAEAIFDGIEFAAMNPEIPFGARKGLMDLVERGRFAPEDQKDPAAMAVEEVATRAEL